MGVGLQGPEEQPQGLPRATVGPKVSGQGHPRPPVPGILLDEALAQRHEAGELPALGVGPLQRVEGQIRPLRDRGDGASRAGR